MAVNIQRRKTVQRLVIHQELARNKSHPTAHQLYRRVRRRIPSISFGTVYRNLNLLKEQGQAQELLLEREAARWDGDVQPHSHLFCLACRRVTDLPLAEPPEWKRRVERQAGFKISSYRLEFYGLCRSCQQKRKGRLSPLRVRR